MLKSLDAAAVRRWAATCCEELAVHRDVIDELNVFPVADQDTGSNLLATMRAGLDAVLCVDGSDAAAASIASALARGAVRGARGNSGVIVSQVLRGLAEGLDGDAEFDGAAVRNGLRRADQLATAAVSEPAPGTVLTVLHAAAQAACDVGSDELCAVVSAARQAAARALADTPRQLAVLARAGVVDAGGQGLVLLLEALLAVVTGRFPVQPPEVTAAPRPARALSAQREAGSAEYEYEVMYLLDGADDDAVTTLRAKLCRIGDCVAVVGTGDGDPVWNVHVHCSDIGTAIEAGIQAGRPHRITVLRFADQIPPSDAPGDRHGGAHGAGDQHRFVTHHTVLAMVSGSGVAELLGGEGATVVPASCDVPEFRTVLAATRARHVSVMACPGTSADTAQAAAEQARSDGQDVEVIPVASPVQALAAIAVHDRQRPAAEDRVAMTEAVAATRRGELTRTGCQPGYLMAVVDGEVVLVERDVPVMARTLLDRMLDGGGELVTVLIGRQAPEDIEQALTGHLRSEHSGVEVALYRGDQPDSVLVIGVE